MTDKNYNIQKESVPISDDVTTDITIYRKKTSKAEPTFLFIPAMGVPADYYKPFALRMADRGWAMITADLRGIGSSSVRASRAVDFGYHDLITADIPATVETVRRLFPKNRLILMGHSLGGQLNTLYTALNPEKVDALVFIAACTVYYKGWPFPINMGILAGTQTAAIITMALGYFPGHRIGFGGREARIIILDWARNARNGDYKILNNETDFESLISHVEIPVLATSFKGDRLCTERAVRNLTGKFKCADITYAHFTELDAPAESLNHFRWAKKSDAVVDKIQEWMDNMF